MFDLLPGAVRLKGVAETVIADDAAGVEDSSVSYYRICENMCSGIDDTFFTDLDIVSDSNIVKDFGAVPDLCLLSDSHEIAYPDLLPYLRAASDTAAAAVASEGFVLRLDILEQICKSAVGVFYPDEGGGDGLLRLEILVYQEDRCLAGIDVMFVFRVREKTEFARFTMFDLCECSRC